MLKRIEAIIWPAKAGDVIEALDREGHSQGMALSEVRVYHGKEIINYYRGAEHRINFVTMNHLLLFVPDDLVNKIRGVIEVSAGQGIISVSDVSSLTDVRTRADIHPLESASNAPSTQR